MLQPPPAAFMHGSQGSGFELTLLARQAGQTGDRPKSKNNAVTRNTTLAISCRVYAYFTKYC